MCSCWLQCLWCYSSFVNQALICTLLETCWAVHLRMKGDTVNHFKRLAVTCERVKYPKYGGILYFVSLWPCWMRVSLFSCHLPRQHLLICTLESKSTSDIKSCDEDYFEHFCLARTQKHVGKGEATKSNSMYREIWPPPTTHPSLVMSCVLRKINAFVSKVKKDNSQAQKEKLHVKRGTFTYSRGGVNWKVTFVKDPERTTLRQAYSILQRSQLGNNVVQWIIWFN